jgi:predicted DNA-binding transcriptional regulator YafY
VVEAIVDAHADVVQRRVGPWATVTDEGGGRCRLRMETHDLGWAALALGSTGVEFTVLAPPELRDLLGDWAGRFARAAGPG